jgi:large subunit ribosomal protein L4
MKLNPLIQYADMEIFKYGYRSALVHQVLVGFLSLGHIGTKKQKMRGEVSGGNKKPWRQKGTGRARAGSTRSPLWRKGGVTFAANGLPGSKVKINKKMFRCAVKSILSQLFLNATLKIFEDLQCTSHKTQDFLKNYQINTKTLIVVNDLSDDLILATRNLHKVLVVTPQEINPSMLVNHTDVYIEHDAVQTLESRLQT